MEKIVYFAGAVRGDRLKSGLILQLVNHIKRLGIPVLSEPIADEDPIASLAHKLGKAKEGLTAEDIETKDISWIDTATHFIAEISGASTGTGREIEYARNKHHFGKTPAKILCLYNKEREFYASPMIRGMKPEKYNNVMIKHYNELEEAKEIIQKFLSE